MSDTSTQPSRVESLVIGGGIAGLVAAKDLALRGDKVTLIESTAHLGGLISSVNLLGQSVDSGAEAFAVSRPNTLQLIESLGLGDKIVRPTRSDARIRIGGKNATIPSGVLGIPASLDDPTLLTSLSESAIRLAKFNDAQPWNLAGSPTIGEVVVNRLGSEFLERLVAPVISGVHASDPMMLEIRTVAPGLMEAATAAGSLVAGVAALRAKASAPGAAVAGFEGGMHQLVAELARNLASAEVEIRLNTEASEVRVGPEAFEVVVKNSQPITARRLVIAVPPHAATVLLSKMPSVSNLLAKIKAVDVAVVALAIQNPDLLNQPLGSGVLIAEGDELIQAKASTHSSAKWSWLKSKFNAETEIIRLSYGRDGAIPVQFDDLIDAAFNDVEALYGIQGSNLLDAKAVVWPKSLIQSVPGHAELVQQITAAVSEVPGLGLVGAGFGGNGITGIIAKTLETTSQIGVRYSHGE